jgi:DNA-binding CsgD family transcriptional regulator
MEHIKILLASEENKIREPLKHYFSAWGMETMEFNKPPEISTIKALSPQLVCMDKKFYCNSDFLSESAEQSLEDVQKPGVVILVKPTDKMPLMEEVGQNSILQIPYTALTLFETVRHALCFSHMELSLGTVLTKLDLIYEILMRELSHSRLWQDETIEFQPEAVKPPKPKQLVEDKDEIILKSKALIISLLKDAKNNGELSLYEGQLNLLEKYLTKLDQDIGHEDLAPCSVTDFLKIHPLSRKELKVFSMINKHMTTEEIADKLFVSPETVKSHRRNIRKKLSLVGNKASIGDFIHHLNDYEPNASSELGGIDNISKIKRVQRH